MTVRELRDMVQNHLPLLTSLWQWSLQQINAMLRNEMVGCCSLFVLSRKRRWKICYPRAATASEIRADDEGISRRMGVDPARTETFVAKKFILTTCVGVPFMAGR